MDVTIGHDGETPLLGDNILTTTACAGGVLSKADDYIQQKHIISGMGKGKYRFSPKFFRI